MSDTQENRAERSITPNRLYSTYGEAHRNIAPRVQDTPRNSDDGVEGRETLPTSPDTVGTDQPTTPNVTIFRGYVQDDLREDRFAPIQHPVGIRPVYFNDDDEEYQLPALPRAAYDPLSPGRVKNFGTSGHGSPHMKQETDYENFQTYQSETSHPDMGHANSGRPLTRQYHMPLGHHSMLPQDRHSDESLDHREYDVSWDSDQGRYRFLKKGAEKEVSQALREYTGASQPSAGVVVEQNTDEYSSELPPSSSHNTPAPIAAAAEKRGRRGVYFYNDAAIQSGWQTEDNGIRVPTSPPPPTSDSRVEYTRPQPWSSLSLEQLSNVPLDDLHAMQSVRDANRGERDDWETVTDERVGSNIHYHDTVMGKHAGGSSIADYSDRLLPEGTRDFGTDQNRSKSPTWWEKPNATVPKGSMKATQGTAVSGFMPFPEMQYPEPALSAFNEGFIPNVVTVSERKAQEMLYNERHRREEDSQYAGDFELTDLRSGRDDPVASELEKPGERSLLPFRWSKVKKEVGAQQAQRDAERAETEPRQIGRPLSGFETLPFSVIELEDARRIQARHRASGLEDQSETGNFVFHHSMVNRSTQRSTVASDPRRPALNAGPDYYTPLSPTTGQMIQPGGSRFSPRSAKFPAPLPATPIRFVDEEQQQQQPTQPQQAHLRGRTMGQGRRSTAPRTEGREFEQEHGGRARLAPPPLFRWEAERLNLLFRLLVILNLVPGLGVLVVRCNWGEWLVRAFTRGRASRLLS